MAASPSTELVVADTNALLEMFPALDPNGEALEAITENLEGETIGVSDLSRITMPTGNSKSWTVPSLTEGETHEAEISGIIVVWSKRRAFFRSTKIDGTPPVCWSTDAKTADAGGAFAAPTWAAEPMLRDDQDEPDFIPGEGWELPKLGKTVNPDGACVTCPANQWGTSLRGGRGKACAEYRSLYMLRPGSVLPSIVSIPATSLGAVKTFLIALAAEGIPHYGAVVGLKLEETETGGQKHARVVPRLVQRLDGEQRAIAKQAKAYFTKMLEQDTANTVVNEVVDGAPQDASIS